MRNIMAHMSPFDAPAGRYAPSPSGDLHFGDLRTAVLAWLFARQSGRPDDLRRTRERKELFSFIEVK